MWAWLLNLLSVLIAKPVEKAPEKKDEAKPVPTLPEKPKQAAVPWYLYALKFKGKTETDPEFSKFMVPKWKLFGLDLGTIATSWAAWCGLAMAVALAGVGLKIQKGGELAMAWDKYGEVIEWRTAGIPQGAIVRINHNFDCDSEAGNHVSMANGDCTAADLLKKGGSIDLFGGNQQNTWKVTTYDAREICAVRWPKDVKDFPKPAKVLRSQNCSSGAAKEESTR